MTALSVFARTLRHLSLTAASDMPALVFEVTPKVLAGVVEQLTGASVRGRGSGGGRVWVG